MSRHLLALAVALAAGLVAGSAFAQSASPLPLDKPGKPDLVQPPADPPKLRRGRYHNLNFLFGALKAAPDEASAKNVENRIWAIWLASGSDTCNLLMTRVKSAVDAEKYDLAIRLLDAIIELKPNYVEAWNRRATVFFLKKDYADALADLAKVLTLEPRHFGALTGLAAIMQDIGDDKGALIAFRKALEIDPHLQGVAEKVKTLTLKVEGQDI
ncbi:MAG TPA: tetratricopeptide repeat protein [Xanthobacteraceae bacterium]|jgi:tetratricopeptide (TPR) repeat protein